MIGKLKYRLYDKLLRLANRLKHDVHDSSAWAPELFYQKIYLDEIFCRLDGHFKDKSPLRILDAGCGTGRIGLDVAQRGHQVTGVDLSAPDVELARQHAADRKISVELIDADLMDFLKEAPSATYDVVLCLEVLSNCVAHREIFQHLVRVLKPGGLLLVSVRTRFYFICTLLRQSKFKDALFVARNTEGLLRVAKIPAYYNWYDQDRFLEMLKENGLDSLTLKGIGKYTGMDYDGMAAVVDLERVPEDALRGFLLSLESEDSTSPWTGRFAFAVAEKKLTANQ